jgi:hypothetical protein
MDGSQITTTTRLVGRFRKMRLASGRSRIPRMPSWEEWSKDEPEEDRSSEELADTNLRQRHPVFPRICQLQLTVYSKLFKDCNTAYRPYEEGKRLQMD